MPGLPEAGEHSYYRGIRHSYGAAAAATLRDMWGAPQGGGCDFFLPATPRGGMMPVIPSGALYRELCLTARLAQRMRAEAARLPAAWPVRDELVQLADSILRDVASELWPTGTREQAEGKPGHPAGL